MRKVHPIRGKHETLYSMLGECMADQKAKKGFVVYFDEEGTMYFGEIGLTLADYCMATVYMNNEANKFMDGN